MEDAKGRLDEDAGGHGHTFSPILDGAGATPAGGGEQAGQGDCELSEADGQDEPDRAEGRSREAGIEVPPGVGFYCDFGRWRDPPQRWFPSDATAVGCTARSRWSTWCGPWRREERKCVRGPEAAGGLGAESEPGGRPGEERREALQVDRQDGQGPGDAGGGTAAPGNGWNILLSSDAQPRWREGARQDQPDRDWTMEISVSEADRERITRLETELAALRDKNNLQEGVGDGVAGDAKAARDAEDAGGIKVAQDAKGAGVPEEVDDAEEASD